MQRARAKPNCAAQHTCLTYYLYYLYTSLMPNLGPRVAILQTAATHLVPHLVRRGIGSEVDLGRRGHPSVVAGQQPQEADGAQPPAGTKGQGRGGKLDGVAIWRQRHCVTNTDRLSMLPTPIKALTPVKALMTLGLLGMR